MQKRIFRADDGTELELRKLSPVAMQLLDYRAEKRKPKPPIVEVPVPGQEGKFRTEPNPNDPSYVQALVDWENDKGTEVMRYVYTVGVSSPVPLEFEETHRGFFGDDLSDADLKFMWVGSFFLSEEQSTRFMNAVMGQTIITPEGLKESEARFSSDGGQAADRGVEIQKQGPGEHPIQSGGGGTVGESVVGVEPERLLFSSRNSDVDRPGSVGDGQV
jgi:hypothetical protein